MPSSGRVSAGVAPPAAGPLAQADSSMQTLVATHIFMVAPSLETGALYTAALGPVRRMAA
jgi:hypothetical protein